MRPWPPRSDLAGARKIAANRPLRHSGVGSWDSLKAAMLPHKFEYRNPKFETISKCSKEQIRNGHCCSRLALSRRWGHGDRAPWLQCENSVIRNLNLFRISSFGFRISYLSRSNQIGPPKFTAASESV